MADKSKGYEKKIIYTFEAGGDEWAVTFSNADVINFEETRKNGQEDCHMGGEAEKIEGKWVLEEYTRKSIDMYGRTGQADDIEAFFNEHGAPG